MWANPRDLIAKYRTTGLLIDTNLLVRLVVGSLDRKLIKSNRADRRPVTEKEFDLLAEIARSFTRIVSTPHILTELSNLTGKLDSKWHGRVREIIRKFVLNKVDEAQVAARDIVQHPLFPRLGVADTAIHLIAPGKYLVLTDELALAETLRKRGVDVINFNHFRMLVDG